MKKIQFIFLSVIMISMTTILNVNAQSIANDKESARIFVQKFYDEYCNSRLKNKDGNYLDATYYIIKNKPQYFNDNLLAALKVYEVKGDIFSPFLSLKDGNDKFNYQTGNVQQSGNIFNIEVYSGLINESRQTILSSPVAVSVEVEKVNEQWKLVNFYYPPYNFGDNFLATIKQDKRVKEEFLKNPRASE